MRRPIITIKQILAWADAHYAACKQWPKHNSGRIPGMLGETWCAIDQAIRKKNRGLSIRSSLAQLLQEHRGVRNKNSLPRLNTKLILKWADSHHDCKGQWPTATSGQVEAMEGETWSAIERALMNGNRGLPGKSSLAKLLYVRRGVWTSHNMPRLTERKILQWVKAHHRRTGTWPTRKSGLIIDAPPERWDRVNASIIQGYRGMPGGSSLARLMNKAFGARNQKALPSLKIKQIVKWADEYQAQHGRWPTHLSGTIPGSDGETWGAVHAALSKGRRGFPGGRSLYRVVKKYRGVPKYRSRRKLVASA